MSVVKALTGTTLSSTPATDTLLQSGLHGQLYPVLLASAHFNLGVEASGYLICVAHYFAKCVFQGRVQRVQLQVELLLDT